MTTRAMSPLRQRMLEDMQLRGLSARTQEAYTRAVAQLARHYQRSPEQLGDEDLREYFLHLTKEKKLARPTVTIALCGLKFFYEQTLKQSWPTLGLVRPQPEHKLPVVLSRAEVRSIRPAAILIARSLPAPAPGLATGAASCPFCHLGQLHLLAVLPRHRPPQPKVPP